MTSTASPNGTTTALTIEYAKPNGRASTTLTARLGDDVLAVESFDVGKSKARTQFAETVCDGRPGIDRTALDAELLRIAAECASTAEAVNTPAVDGDELDTQRIVRPERIITAEVNGLTVPTMMLRRGKPAGQSRLYLRWPDSRREMHKLEPSLDTGAGRLWIHPQPAEPAANQPSGWSQHARKAWLAGAAPPSPPELFSSLCERIAYFVDLPAPKAAGVTATLSLWATFTYVYHAFDATPYLFVGGPLGSGKSRVFEILARIAFRPCASSNLTAAAMFRTLHDRGGTLLLDEAERLKQTAAPDVSELLSMLLAGYKRGGQATRLETIGDTFRPVAFDVYGPKALACIAGLPPALASRCITVSMFRSPAGSEKPRRRIDAEPARWQRLRDDLHAVALEHGSTWLDLAGRDDVCPEMSGRDYELWQPLLALAAWLDERGAKGLLDLMQQHALETIDDGRDDSAPDYDETLIRVLAEAVRAGDSPTPSEVLEAARREDNKTFEKWSPRGVSSHLKTYGVTVHRSNGRRSYSRVAVDDLRTIQATYSLDLGCADE